ncbi:MAG TPA: hypothetical protein VH114_11095 [Candidatus Acidoferrum sp.]|jgi:hypothetical protein|nr:hypothetical protein [Candidatus Acidoferrum sp.]
MKKHYLKIFLALVGFAGLSGIAQAQSHQEIVVTLPFDFVASGKTLPAGTYTVSRISENNFDLVLSNQAKHVGVLVHPIEVEDARADKSTVSFERVGESRFLAKVETADYVYSISVSRAAITEAAMKTDAMRSSASGSN